jgi:hypothetical protein
MLLTNGCCPTRLKAGREKANGCFRKSETPVVNARSYVETPGVNARGSGSLGNDNYTLQAHVEESTYEQETGT